MVVENFFILRDNPNSNDNYVFHKFIYIHSSTNIFLNFTNKYTRYIIKKQDENIQTLFNNSKIMSLIIQTYYK